MAYTHPKPLPLTVAHLFFIKRGEASAALPLVSISRNIITLQAITVAGAPRLKTVLVKTRRYESADGRAESPPLASAAFSQCSKEFQSQCTVRDGAIGRRQQGGWVKWITRSAIAEMIGLRSIQITPGMPIGSGLGRCGLLRRGHCLWRPGQFIFWLRARCGRRPVWLGRCHGVSDGWRVRRNGQWHHNRGRAIRSSALFGAGARRRRLGAASRGGTRQRCRAHQSDTSHLS